MRSSVLVFVGMFLLEVALTSCGGATRDGDAKADVFPGDWAAEKDFPGDPDSLARDDVAFPFPKGFHLGVATSAHQIEGGLNNTWTQLETLPQFEGLTVEPSGVACDHYNRFEEDLDLIASMGLDTFRFSIEWSRIEPQQGSWDEGEVQHYRDVLEAAAGRGIMPSVTLHHFTEPTWFLDLQDLQPPFNDDFCPEGPTEQDFCGWFNPESAVEFGEFCGRMAEEYGDRVDEWWTFNEASGYWSAAVLSGEFPPLLSVDPLKVTVEDLQAHAIPIMRNLLQAHVNCYRAIQEHDKIDADGDGVPARVGMTIGTGMTRPADKNNPKDVAAALQTQFASTFQFTDAVMFGEVHYDYDGSVDEMRADWAGTLDMYGVQYYASSVVVGFPINGLLEGVPCIPLGDPTVTELMLQLGCPPPSADDWPLGEPEDKALYGMQHDPAGLLELLRTIHQRYPDLPLVITENGFANDPVKRAHSLVRHLKVCHEALEEGLPLEGYYHWSLLDNFEWGRGFGVRFGLFEVDFAGDLARTPTLAVDIYRDIASHHGLTQSLLDSFGGQGALR